MPEYINPTENFLNFLHSTEDFDTAAKAYREAEIAKDLNLLNQPLGSLGNEATKGTGMLSKITNAFANFGKNAGNIGNIVTKGGAALRGAAIGTLGTPLAAGTSLLAATPAAIDTAKAIMNANKVNQQIKNDKSVEAAKKALIAQGYDELTAHQIANGLPVQAFDDEELKQLESRKAETDNLVAKAQKDLEKAKESYNAALTQASSQPIPPTTNNTNVAQPSGGDNLPMPNIQQTGANDNVLAQVVNEPLADAQLDVRQVEQPEGQVTTQDMLNRLDAYYNNLSQTIKNDPRYSGDIVQPNTPYNINPEQLARYQSYDQFAKAFGVDGGMADLYQNQARQMYDQQMANQLGVPYEDYIAATTERRKYDILAQSQQIQDALQIQANQAKDMQTKLGILQKMQEVREKANNDLLLEDMKGRYDLAKAGMAAQAQRDVANINAMGDIAKQQMYLTAPTTQLNAAGNYMGNLMGYGGGAVTLSNLLALSPQQRVALWGQNVSDDAIRAMFANVRGIPATALQQPQLNQQQGGSQGFLPGLANFINPQR